MEVPTSSASQSTNSHYNLDNLPDLIYNHIFKYLDLDDVLELRSINKNFYFIVKSYNVREISFLDDVTFGTKDNWFTTNKSTNLRNQLHISKFCLIRKPSDNFINLKHLRIDLAKRLPFQLEDLNKFTNLEVLYINNTNFKIDSQLDLPNLKALSIECFSYSPTACLVIKTPILQSLKIWRLRFFKLHEKSYRIDVKNPLSIKYLGTDSFYDDFLPFVNLECLEVFGNFEINWLNFDLDTGITKFSKLTKLKLNHVPGYKKKNLRDLFKSKNDALEILLDGVKAKVVNKFYEADKRRGLIEFQLNNYNELDDDLQSITFLSRANLILFILINNPPADLFKKYTNIRMIEVSALKVEDESRLIHLISQCPNLYDIEVSESSLSQQFYDQLPTISSLTRLVVYNNHYNLDIGFINNIKYLIHFVSDRNSVENLDLNNLKHLKYLRKLEIYISSIQRTICLDKKSKDRFMIFSRDECLSGTIPPERKFMTSDEIFEYAYHLETEKSRSKRSRLC